MQITVDKSSKTPIYIQIKNQISDLIIKGELQPNFILPAERTLAAKLEVNRSTVIRAYMELKAEGFVEARQGSGTVILAQMDKKKAGEKVYIPPIRWNQLESRLYIKNEDTTISRILSVFEAGKVISFASGIMSEESCHFEKMKEIHMELYDKYKEKLLMPTPVQGSLELRNTLKSYLKKKGIHVGQNQILVTSGSQQAIEFMAKLFIEPGDVVLIEEPSYTGALQTFESYGAKIIGIPIEEDGMDLQVLETCLIKYRPKFIYIQPTFQNPTGITMSLEKRKELLHLAYYYQIPIIEDSPYDELRFEGRELPSLKALDHHDYVLYISSFSKTISFSLRVGYIVASEQIIDRLRNFKQVSDIQTSTQSQYLVCEILKKPYFEEQLKFLRVHYKEKRDRMIRELEKSKIEGLEIFTPEGGFFIWCRLPQEIRMGELLQSLGKEGVAVMPGEVFFPKERAGESYLRLNYSYPTEEDIVEGTNKLIHCIKRCLGLRKNSRIRIDLNIDPFL